MDYKFDLGICIVLLVDYVWYDCKNNVKNKISFIKLKICCEVVICFFTA
jgi:hypothetical protein